MEFISILTASLLATALLLLFIRPRRPVFETQLKPEWLFVGQLVCVFGLQLLHIRNEEYNVDESTWIANSLAVINDEHFFSALLTHTTARPITVLPLLALDKLGLQINFYSIKVVGLICTLLTLVFTYLSLRNLTGARLATLFIFPLSIFYAVIQFEDFSAYNSELVCNVFIASGIWLYSSIIRKCTRVWQLCLAGLMLGLIPFTKFQAIPGALIIAGFCIYEWVDQRRFKPALLFTITGLVPLIITLFYCLHTDQLTVLIKNYFLYYFHYSYQYSEKPLSDRFSARDILWFYRKQYTFAMFWFGLILAVFIGMWHSKRSQFRWSSMVLMAVLLWIVSIYETIQAGTGYEHYQNLVLVPHTLLAAVVIYSSLNNQPFRFSLPVYAYLGVALLVTLFTQTMPFERGYSPPLTYDSQVIALIKKECKSVDRIAIWGWADRYYALSGIAPATRYANTVFQMKANAQQAYYLQQYTLDLQVNKPRLIIDAVAENQFTYNDQRKYGHEQFPSVDRIIRHDYELIYEHEGLRAYKLKNDFTDVAVN